LHENPLFTGGGGSPPLFLCFPKEGDFPVTTVFFGRRQIKKSIFLLQIFLAFSLKIKELHLWKFFP